MAPKNVLVIALVVLCCAGTFVECTLFPVAVGGNNLAVGTKGATDVLAAELDIDESTSIFPRMTVSFPGTSGTNTKLITYIQIIDRSGNGKSAPPKIVDGGVGRTSVTIAFTSTPFSPNFAYTILIFVPA